MADTQTENEPALPLLRKNAHLLLLRRLDEAVAERPALGPLCETLLRPIEILTELARETPAALGDDPPAGERFRLLLASGRTVEINPDAAAALLAQETGSHELGHAPGLMDPAALALIGLAAIRVGHPSQMGMSLLRTVHALALAAGPAEVLARLGADGPRRSALALLLKSFANGDASAPNSRFAAVATLVADPAERARWACLQQLFGNTEGLVTAEIERMREWDGAHARDIRLVENATAWPDEPCALSGSFAAAQPAATVVVFASPGTRPLAVPRAETSWKRQRIGLVVPDGATPGWIGFADRAQCDRSNAERKALRKRWSESRAPCLAGSSVPTALIPDLVHPSVPPRTASNVFVGGLPRVRQAALRPPEAPAGTPFVLTWETDGADRVRIEQLDGGVPPQLAGPQGELSLSPPEEIDELRVRVVPLSVRGPEAGGAATLAGTPSAELIGRVSGGQDGGELAVVLLRPAVVAQGPEDALLVDRVVDDAARAALRRASRAANARLVAIEPAYVADELALVFEAVRGAADPRVSTLCTGLARAARAAPLYERALWVALLPGEESWYATAASPAARLIAVATAAGLAELLAKLPPQALPELAPVAERLRLGGKLWSDGALALDPVRVDRRAASAQAGGGAALSCVSLDAQGRELAVEEVRPLGLGSPASFEVLPTLSPEVTAVELRAAAGSRTSAAANGGFHLRPSRRSSELLARVVRPKGVPRLEALELEGTQVTWRYAHAAGAQPEIAVEVATAAPFFDSRGAGDEGSDDVILRAVAAGGLPPCWSTLLESMPCEGRETIPFHRVAQGESRLFRLVASDGWNSVSLPLPPGPPTAGAVVARWLGAGRYFADVPEEASVEWTLEGRPLGTAPVVELPRGAKGALELRASLDGEGSAPIVDRVWLGD